MAAALLQEMKHNAENSWSQWEPFRPDEQQKYLEMEILTVSCYS